MSFEFGTSVDYWIDVGITVHLRRRLLPGRIIVHKLRQRDYDKHWIDVGITVHLRCRLLPGRINLFKVPFEFGTSVDYWIDISLTVHL